MRKPLKLTYVAGFPNGDHERFEFSTTNNLISKSDIRDYEWGYAERFNHVRQFTKGLSTRTIPVTFYQRRSGAVDELYKAAEEMYAIFDRDVVGLTFDKPMGKLWVGEVDGDGYYINCYIIGSEKKEYDNGVAIKLDLTVLSDFRWHKEITQEFGTVTPDPSGDFYFLDYEYDYEYDYGNASNITDITQFQNEAIAPFDFKITFFGPVENPMVTVGNNIYRVYTTLYDGDILIVDSLEKRVYCIKANGTEINMFNMRDRENYIFEKMPIENDQAEVVWQEGATVQITAYIERSEPLWI